MAIHERIRLLLSKLKHYLVTFNLFPSVPPTTNEYELQNQKISTRLFIILLTLILTILLLYTSLATITKTVIVKTPTLDQYFHLYAKYPQTLTCACTKISIEHKKLVNVKYSLHQVCTSDFVTDDWIHYLALSSAGIILNYDDFRWTAPYSFQALRAFCELINTTISNSLDQFYSSGYISAFVIPSELLQSQVQASIDQFKSSTEKSFLLSLSLIRDTIQGNELYSAVQTNYLMFIPLDDSLASTLPRNYSGCTCDSSSACSYQSTIQNYSNSTVLFTIPGFYVGCYVIESLLKSTLECLYNQTCISILQSFCTSPIKINVRALDSSLSSKYFVNSTIQELVNNLMVEEWNSTETYNIYYGECQPAQCIYTYTARNDLIYIVTTLIGLLGGLITVLKLVVPTLVKFVRRIFGSPRLDTGKIKYSIMLYIVNIYISFHLVFGEREQKRRLYLLFLVIR
jgi:hypothetical protein